MGKEEIEEQQKMYSMSSIYKMGELKHGPTEATIGREKKNKERTQPFRIQLHKHWLDSFDFILR